MENYIIKESFLVVLDSRNASSYLNYSWNSSLIFEFEDPIKHDDSAIQMTCSVLNFSCSNSIYNINETNNYLSINNDYLELSSQLYEIYIPYGNYNFITLQNYLKNKIGSIQLLLDVNTNKITFTNNIPFIINGESTLLNILGGISKLDYYSQNINSIYTIIMQYQCNFNGVNNINIHMTNINTKNIDSYTKSNCSLIQSIQVYPYAPQIIFTKTNDYSFTINQNIIGYIQIDIKDDLQRFINFNNSSWNLTLCFTLLKEISKNSNNFYSILENAYNSYT